MHRGSRPDAEDEPFAIRDQFTVYEAAMIMRAGTLIRVSVIGGSIKDHERFLRGSAFLKHQAKGRAPSEVGISIVN